MPDTLEGKELGEGAGFSAWRWLSDSGTGSNIPGSIVESEVELDP